jgi:hypothetical protein
MLANEDDIITCYKTGLKKTNIIKHYGISKMRLNRILEGIEASKKPASYNDYMIAPDLTEHICNFPKSYGLARVMQFAQLAGLDLNKIFENRRVKHEDINLTEDIISLLNAGVKKTIISALDWDGSGAGLDISGMRKILKRHKVEIKTDFRTKIKMTEEQKNILRKLYEKHHIAATFSNAVKIIHYVNEFLTSLDPNDFIKILLETNQEIDQEKFSENLQFYGIGEALHEFENYMTGK